jgi:hypothetical protein
VFDQYVGPSITMIRARLSGDLLQTMFTIEDVAAVDLPPVPDVTTAEALDLTLENTPRLNALADDAPPIGVIDSGLNDHPFLANIIAGAIGVPADLGTATIGVMAPASLGSPSLAIFAPSSLPEHCSAAHVIAPRKSSTSAVSSTIDGSCRRKCARR